MHCFRLKNVMCSLGQEVGKFSSITTLKKIIVVVVFVHIRRPPADRHDTPIGTKPNLWLSGEIRMFSFRYT